MSGSYSSGVADKIRYLFIDGGCLDSLIERISTELFGGKQIDINYYRIPLGGYHKVFYYDCLPSKKSIENDIEYQNRIQPKIELFNYLKSLDRFHVYEGTARFRDKQRGQEQKQVDIMIAVDMLTHTFHKNMHEATLLTGDLDFKPLIDALVQNGMHVNLWYPKDRTNYELIDAADSRKALNVIDVLGWCDENFKTTINIPTAFPEDFNNVNMEWTLLENETIKERTYEAFFYEKEGVYAAKLPKENYYHYLHNNLKQLKFYIDNIFSPDVKR